MLDLLTKLLLNNIKDDALSSTEGVSIYVYIYAYKAPFVALTLYYSSTSSQKF
jgi:hypothetical protein